MRSHFYLLALSILLLQSCEKSATDEFEEGNGQVSAKHLEAITIMNVTSSDEGRQLRIFYDENGRVSNVRQGEANSTFAYDGDQLDHIAGDAETLSAEQLYGSPYGAFETGEVLSYDDKGNPVEILFLDRVPTYYGDYRIVEYTAEITYDDTPNPYFYTLKAAGIINLLDKVQLNLSMSPQASEIVQARLLFPINNLKEILYRDTEGNPVYEIRADYVYDEQNYPISASVTSNDFSGFLSVQTVIFSYRE